MAPQGKHNPSPDWESSSRGERAWKEVLEDTASRNSDARKAGRVERETYEKQRDEARRAAAAERQTKLLKRRLP